MNEPEEEKVSSEILQTPVCSVNNAMDSSSPGNFSEDKSRKRKSWLKTLSVMSSEEDDLDRETSPVKSSLPTDQVWELRFPYPMVSDDSEDDDEEVFQPKPTKKKGIKRKLHFSDEELEVENENKSFKEKKRKVQQLSQNQSLLLCNVEKDNKIKKRKRKISFSKKEAQDVESEQDEFKKNSFRNENPKISLENLKSECIEMQYADPTCFLMGGSLKKAAKAKTSKFRKKSKVSKYVEPIPPIVKKKVGRPSLKNKIEPLKVNASTWKDKANAKIDQHTNTEYIPSSEGHEEIIIVDPKRFLESSDEENESNMTVSKFSGRRLHDLSTSSNDSDSENDTNPLKSKRTLVKPRIQKHKPKSLHCISSSSEDENMSQVVTNDKTEVNKLYCDKGTADLGTFNLKQEKGPMDPVLKNIPVSSGKKLGKPSLKKKVEDPVKVNASAWKNIANAPIEKYHHKSSSTSHKSIVNNLKKQLAFSNIAEVEIRRRINDNSNRIDKEKGKSAFQKSSNTPKENPNHRDQTKENIFLSQQNLHQDLNTTDKIAGVIVENRNPIENNYTVNLNVYCNPSHESENNDYENGKKNNNESKTSLDINFSLTHSEKRDSSSASKKVRHAHNRKPIVQQSAVGKESMESLNKHNSNVEEKLGKGEVRENIPESSSGIDVLGNILSEMEKNPYKMSKPANNSVEPANHNTLATNSIFHMNPVHNFIPYTPNSYTPNTSVVVNPSFPSSSNISNEGLKNCSPSINPLKEGLFFSNLSPKDSLGTELLRLFEGTDLLRSQTQSGKTQVPLSTSNYPQNDNIKMGGHVTSKETPVDVLSVTESKNHTFTGNQSQERSKLVIPFYSVRNEDYNTDNENQVIRLPNNEAVSKSQINVDNSEANRNKTPTYNKTDDKYSGIDVLHTLASCYQGVREKDSPMNKSRLNDLARETVVVSNIHKLQSAVKYSDINKSKTDEDPSYSEQNNREEKVKEPSDITKHEITKPDRQAHTLSSSEDENNEPESSVSSPNKTNQASPKGIRVRFGGSEYRFKGPNQIVKNNKPKTTEDKVMPETNVPKRKLSFSKESSSSSSSSSQSSSNSSDSESSDDEPDKASDENNLGGETNTNDKSNKDNTPCLTLSSTESTLEQTKNKYTDTKQDVFREVITLSSDSETEDTEQINRNNLGDSTLEVQSPKPAKETLEQSSSTSERNQASGEESHQVKEMSEDKVITPTPSDSNNVGKIRIKSLFELGVQNEGSLPENALITSEAAACVPDGVPVDKEQNQVIKILKYTTKLTNFVDKEKLKKTGTKSKSSFTEQNTEDIQDLSTSQSNLFKRKTDIAKPMFVVKRVGYHRPNIIRAKKISNQIKQVSPKNPSSTEKSSSTSSSQTLKLSTEPSSLISQPSTTTEALQKNSSIDNNLQLSNTQVTRSNLLNFSANTNNVISSNSTENINRSNILTLDTQSSAFQNPCSSTSQVVFAAILPISSFNTNNILPKPGNQSTSHQTSILDGSLQTPLLAEQSLDTIKCFEFFNDFFSELTCMKIPKLIDELHLLITYDIIRDEQRQKVGQLLHPETAAIETRRAEKDFADKLKTRAQEFIPLLMTILKKVDEKALKLSVLALYCRIVQLLERINPNNVRYRFRLRTLIKSMLEKQPLAATVNIDFFFTESENNFISSFNQMYGKLMSYEAYIEELRRTEPEQTPQAMTPSEAKSTQEELSKNVSGRALQTDCDKSAIETHKTTASSTVLLDNPPKPIQSIESHKTTASSVVVLNKSPKPIRSSETHKTTASSMVVLDKPPKPILPIETHKTTSSSTVVLNSPPKPIQSKKTLTQSGNAVVEPKKVSKSVSLDVRETQMDHLINELVSLNKLMKNASEARNLFRSKSLIDHSQRSANTSQTNESYKQTRPDSLTDHNYQMRSTQMTVTAGPKTAVTSNTSLSMKNSNSSTNVPEAPLKQSTELNTWTAATLLNVISTCASASSSTTVVTSSSDQTKSSTVVDSQNSSILPLQQSSATSTSPAKPGGLDQLFLAKFLKGINKNDDSK